MDNTHESEYIMHEEIQFYHTDYYKDAELSALVAQLNLFYPDFSPWRETTANRSHEDLFGEQIKRGDTYYRRQAGEAWDDAIKLSELSMARLVYSLWHGNGWLEVFSDRLKEIDDQRLRQWMEKLG